MVELDSNSRPIAGVVIAEVIFVLGFVSGALTFGVGGVVGVVTVAVSATIIVFGLAIAVYGQTVIDKLEDATAE